MRNGVRCATDGCNNTPMNGSSRCFSCNLIRADGNWLCGTHYDERRKAEIQKNMRPRVQHYAEKKFEPIDVIRDWQKNVPPEIRFDFGCMLKYLGRLGSKGDGKEAVVSDLEKVRNYAQFAIDCLKGS